MGVRRSSSSRRGAGGGSGLTVSGVLAVLAVFSVLAVGACGDDTPGGATRETPPVTGPGTVPTTVTLDEAPAIGWIGGEPSFGSTGGGGGGGDDDDGDGGGRTGSPEAMDGASDSEGSVTADASGPPRAASSPEPDSSLGPLRAGSVDDNADFGRFLDYLGRIAALGIPLREFDPSGRIVVQVTGSSGLPVAGAQVVVTTSDGAEVARVRTTADGTARFHPLAYGPLPDVDTSFEFAVGEIAGTAEPGGSVELVVADTGGATPPVALDVLFLLDATGSMGDEIDQLKVSIDSVADRVAALEGAPDVRFAMTLYRDLGDDFVTATYDFTADVAAFRAALADVVADGGGDYPEALDEGLAEALTLASWREPASTIQLVFLVADAPPQIGRQVETPYPASIVDAIGRGIKIFPVASSESDDQAEAVFRQLAQATGAPFVFLAYGAAGAATGASTDIDRTDYEELALDDLVVRLIAEELAALTGDPGAIPPPTPTTTTVPAGQ